MQDKYRCFTAQNLNTVQFIWHYSHLETVKINVQLTFLFEARLVSGFKTIHLFFSTEVRSVKLIPPRIVLPAKTEHVRSMAYEYASN